MDSLGPLEGPRGGLLGASRGTLLTTGLYRGGDVFLLIMLSGRRPSADNVELFLGLL